MSNQETNQEQIQFPAQQELKHLRTRCGDAPVGGTVRRKAPADGGAGTQPDCDARG